MDRDLAALYNSNLTTAGGKKSKQMTRMITTKDKKGSRNNAQSLLDLQSFKSKNSGL